ncbi:MAG: mevalonate kinase [Candidatus Thorarchaeota archaeon]
MSKNNFKSTEGVRRLQSTGEECESMGTGQGYGKSILFGEHFVVYGHPSLAAGIAAKTTAKVIRADKPGWALEDHRLAMPGYKEKKAEEQKVSIENVLNFCGIDASKDGIRIELGGDLVCASGVGASAASCVAIARALNEEFGLDMNDGQINDAAYEGEKGYHGVPSGIDNTASTFGGLIWYIRNPEDRSYRFETIKLEEPMHLVIATTGLTASTKEVVGDVRTKKDADPKWFTGIAEEYEALVHEAKNALLSFDKAKVGILMNKNHGLLQQITVSCKELDHLTEVARSSGALGAKMTGTGRGGNMISLAQDVESAEKIGDALKSNGAVAYWVTSFGL